MWRGPRWSRKKRGPLVHAAAGLGGPKTQEAPAPMRRGPQWSQREGGPRGCMSNVLAFRGGLVFWNVPKGIPIASPREFDGGFFSTAQLIEHLDSAVTEPSLSRLT